MLQQIHDRIAVVLAEGVRFADVQEEVVVLVAMGVVDYRVGRGEDAPSLHGTHSRAVSGVVEELARHRKTSQFLCAEVSFQPVEYQRAHSSHINPRTQHRDCAHVV